MRVEFKFLVFEGNRAVEKLTNIQDFASELEFANALAAFSAMQSGVRLNPLVTVLYNKGENILLPPARGGYGPNTWAVIEEINLFGY